MKNLLTLIIFLFACVELMGQNQINGKVSAGDSINIKVGYVMPLEFPKIEVLFHAEDMQGFPYWGLSKNELRAFENDEECEVISLTHFGDKVPINIMLVLDHSGSMEKDYWGYWYNNLDIISDLPMGDTSWFENVPYPLLDAVNAIKTFIPSFDEGKDNIGLVTFSESVDLILPLGTTKNTISSALDTIVPFTYTAFYDAVDIAISELKGKEGLNVVLALTDGYDNASQRKPFELINNANKSEVSLYCIGLGDVARDTLQLLADSTNGFFVYTNNSSSLDSVYKVLEQKIDAYYLLTYQSENWSSEDESRDFTLNFNAENISLSGNSSSFKLSADVIAYLMERENLRMITIGGLSGVFIVSMIGWGIWNFRRKNKNRIVINSVYPNPGNGNFTIDITFPIEHFNVQLRITDTNGLNIYEDNIIQGSNTIDISSRGSGIYLIFLSHPNLEPASTKYLLNS